jgi:hypothetical protein
MTVIKLQVSVLIDEEENIHRYGTVADEWHLDTGEAIKIRHPTLNNLVTEYHLSEVKIHQRKMVVVPLIYFTDESRHVSPLVKHILTDLIFDPTGGLIAKEGNDQFPGLKERIREIHFGSDGAAAHFKQAVMMHSLYTLYDVCQVSSRLLGCSQLHIMEKVHGMDSEA